MSISGLAREARSAQVEAMGLVIPNASPTQLNVRKGVTDSSGRQTHVQVGQNLGHATGTWNGNDDVDIYISAC